MTTASPTVTGLNIHPIKSCRSLAVEQISLDQYGVVDDRRLMVVDSSGRFVSQRKFPILATVCARYISEGDNERVLTVSAPSASCELRLIPVMTGPRVACTVWGNTVQLVDQGDKAATWFSNLFGLSGLYRLVGCGDGGYDRLVDNLPPSLKHRLPPMSVGLADAAPVSIVSHESLGDLNTRMNTLYNTEVPLNRFRMNIEIVGVSAAFEEDTWLLVRVGEVPFLAYANAEVRESVCGLLVGIILHVFISN